MQTSQIVQYAHALYRAHGDKAEVEAAQKADQAQSAETANDWRRIRLKIRELRGPRVN